MSLFSYEFSLANKPLSSQPGLLEAPLIIFSKIRNAHPRIRVWREGLLLSVGYKHPMR